MKKTLLNVFAVTAALFAFACGSPCNDLVCANCDDTAGLKAACESIVTADNSDACQAALDIATYDSCR